LPYFQPPLNRAVGIPIEAKKRAFSCCGVCWAKPFKEINQFFPKVLQHKFDHCYSTSAYLEIYAKTRQAKIFLFPQPKVGRGRFKNRILREIFGSPENRCYNLLNAHKTIQEVFSCPLQNQRSLPARFLLPDISASGKSSPFSPSAVAHGGTGARKAVSQGPSSSVRVLRPGGRRIYGLLSKA
jgi:hypothetical protein